ncbi:MAG: TIGR03364 family FAD-dependent oxidoreductase [Alphaproteobacteria bacterium]|nr:TIGR03364 family FAD-dependent oxidoreductase [Alphaproteobacteria bacterium]
MALAANKKGWRTIVVERDAVQSGASIRNFGFVTVTGQAQDLTWTRARRSRDIWADIAPRAGISIQHQGVVYTAEREEALSVLEEFAHGPMGGTCELLSAGRLANRMPFAGPNLRGGLWSPHELRIDAREAIPKLTRYLSERRGVDFAFGTAATGVEPSRLQTSRGIIEADRIVICPGTDRFSLLPHAIASHRPRLTKLQMLRLAPQPRGWRLPGAIMGELSLLRYLGFADCPSLPALRARLEAEEPLSLTHGIHIIMVQNADGSIILGDSHQDAEGTDSFYATAIEAEIMAQAARLIRLPVRDILERWTGHYPVCDAPTVIDFPMPGVCLLMVTGGTGMSTAFALAEEALEGFKP